MALMNWQGAHNKDHTTLYAPVPDNGIRLFLQIVTST